MTVDPFTRPSPPATIELRGPADADHFRVKVGRYGDRWYADPLPACEIADVTDAAWPSVSTIKKASGSDWTLVGLKRVAHALETDQYKKLAGWQFDDRYEALKAINKNGLSRAAQRGTNVHRIAESLLYDLPCPVLAGEPGYEYRSAVEQFFNTYQPTLVAAEFVCIHRTLHGTGYGGTADAIIELDGRRYLVDWKSRGEESDHGAYPEEAAQIAGYARAQYIIAEGPQRQPVPRLDGGLIVSIKPDGARIYPIDLDVAFAHFTALHHWWTARRAEREAIGKPYPPRTKVVSEPNPSGTGTTVGEVEPAALAPSPIDISQGADLSHQEFELLWAKIRHEHAALPAMRQMWVNDLALQARQAAVSFHTKSVQTERSYHLCKALVTLAAGGADDNILEVLMDNVTAHRTSTASYKTLGAWVGSLNHAQAEQLANLADQWATKPTAA